MLKSINTRAAEVSAIRTGERALENERVLHQALRARAVHLSPTSFPCAGSGLFDSFLTGGFECATHRRRDGRRLDLTSATHHDVNAAADYRMLQKHGIRTVRDGLRWHLIETRPGWYDWSSFVRMLRASHATHTQVIWDLAHWGWPDHIDMWTPAFIDGFARFARAAAQVVRDETDHIPFYVPVNEISFWAWAGGSLGLINPFACDAGDELKAILVRA